LTVSSRWSKVKFIYLLRFLGRSGQNQMIVGVTAAYSFSDQEYLTKLTATI